MLITSLLIKHNLKQSYQAKLSLTRLVPYPAPEHITVFLWSLKPLITTPSRRITGDRRLPSHLRFIRENLHQRN